MGKSENKSSVRVTLILVAIIPLMSIFVWIPIVNSIMPHYNSPQNSCINNLRQLEVAKQEWALENGKTNGAVCTENDIKNFIKLDSNGNLPRCPQGGIYTIGKVGAPPTCSLSNAVPPHVLP
jgi:general secretion pathway protein G